MNGCLMVEPSDRPPQFAHLDMLKSNIVLCDKPFLGSSVSRQAAIDSIEMAGIAWGGTDRNQEPTRYGGHHQLFIATAVLRRNGRGPDRIRPSRSGQHDRVAHDGRDHRPGDPARSSGAAERRNAGRCHPGPAGQSRGAGHLWRNLNGHRYANRRPRHRGTRTIHASECHYPDGQILRAALQGQWRIDRCPVPGYAGRYRIRPWRCPPPS